MYVCMYTWFKVINKNSIFCLGAPLLILIIFNYYIFHFISFAEEKTKQKNKNKTIRRN